MTSLLLLNVVDSLVESRKTMAEKRRLFARWAAVEMEFMKNRSGTPPGWNWAQPEEKTSLQRETQGPGAGAPFQGTDSARYAR